MLVALNTWGISRFAIRSGFLYQMRGIFIGVMSWRPTLYLLGCCLFGHCQCQVTVCLERETNIIRIWSVRNEVHLGNWEGLGFLGSVSGCPIAYSQKRTQLADGACFSNLAIQRLEDDKHIECLGSGGDIAATNSHEHEATSSEAAGNSVNVRIFLANKYAFQPRGGRILSGKDLGISENVECLGKPEYPTRGHET